MSTAFGHIPIVNDGLVFFVDTYNNKSYVSGDTTTNDLVNDLQCSLSNGVGFNDKSWTFDGVDDYIDTDSLLPVIQNDTQGTIEAWVKMNDASASNITTIFGIGDANVDTYINYRVQSNGTLVGVCRFQSTVQWSLVSNSSSFNDNEWVHVVITQNAITPKMYINGELVSSPSVTLDTTRWIGDFPLLDTIRIGCTRANIGGPNVWFWDGDISNVKYYNRPLSAEEIKQNYNALKWRFK